MKHPKGRVKKTGKRFHPVKHRKSAKRANSPDARKPRIGLRASIERVIPREWTIAAYDPRLPAVLSTPAMIGMMEIAAAESVLPELPPGAITVGTRIEVDHLKAVPEGATVRATARLVKHQGRFLVFDVEARSNEYLLGRGRVFRAIVEPQKFAERADSRKQS
ncbi:MAG: hotdog domain-containing protein [Candidatus Acidiferrales bacterium]